MSTTSLALVEAPARPDGTTDAPTEAPPTVDAAASRGADDDALTPDAILRALAKEIGSDPFAGGKRTHAIRTAGQSLRGAVDRVRAARAHLAECEAEANAAALRALAVLTGAP